MGDTIGYETINDRTSGWGDGYGAGGAGAPGYVDPSLQPVADATPETTTDALARLKKVRKHQKADNQPSNADRSAGVGGTFTPASGADAGYGLSWHTGLTVGTDDDLEAKAGSDTVYTASMAEYSGTRASKPLPTWNANGSVTPNASYTSDPVQQAAS